MVSTIDNSKRQSDLFDLEKKRQIEEIGRIEKIQISYEGPPENVEIVVNKNLSTPYDCARRKYLFKFLHQDFMMLFPNKNKS